MEDHALRHKGCGGRVVLNVADSFDFLTPSMSFTSDGINIGPLELRTKAEKVMPSFICASCSASISSEDAPDKIEVRCSVCQESKPVKEVSSSRMISCVCNSCKEHLMGEGKGPMPEKVARVSKYIELKESGVKFYTLVSVLKKPVQL